MPNQESQYFEGKYTGKCVREAETFGPLGNALKKEGRSQGRSERQERDLGADRIRVLQSNAEIEAKQLY